MFSFTLEEKGKVLKEKASSDSTGLRVRFTRLELGKPYET